MRSRVRCLPLALAILAEPAPGDDAPQLSESLRTADAHVYHCHDGDTCRVQVGGAMWMNVRLAGIDAPEVEGKRKGSGAGQPAGNLARDFLNGLVEEKDLKLRQVDLDQYNRPVVELLLGDVVLNLRLVEEGYAEVYRGKVKRLDQAPYLAAEEVAKKAKKGIWGLKDYESPAAYRKKQKRK